MKVCFQERALLQGKYLRGDRGDEMNQGTLAEQKDAGRLACDTQ